MKELDDSAETLACHLAEHRKQWLKAHRLEPHLVWIDGDVERLSGWAHEKGLQGVVLLVVQSSADGLDRWRLPTNSPAFHVLTRPSGIVVATRATDDTKELDALLTQLKPRRRQP